MNTFWYVYNPEASKPTYKHYSYQSALEEAGRLAEQTRGAYIILEAKSVVTPAQKFVVTNLIPQLLGKYNEEPPF